jgi:hypothetical protein
VYRDIFNFYFDARSLNREDEVPRVRLWTYLSFGLEMWYSRMIVSVFGGSVFCGFLFARVGACIREIENICFMGITI